MQVKNSNRDWKDIDLPKCIKWMSEPNKREKKIGADVVDGLVNLNNHFENALFTGTSIARVTRNSMKLKQPEIRISFIGFYVIK